jgi:hypothetical protein
VITEFLTIGGDGPALAADITRPDLGAPVAGVVVCHPHPAYGGTRESHIVRALVRAFVTRGMAALTFDFRGVGESQGEIEGSTTEWGDVTRALDALEDALPPGTPLALAGYSFGAWCACNVAAGDPRVRAVALVAPGASMPATLDGRPIAIAHPENDHITDPEVLADWLQSIGGGELAVIHGADHYLRDRADEVSDYLGDFLVRSLTARAN